jgi:hypothetical protein
MEKNICKKFKVACALAGTTQTKFACKQGIGWAAVYNVMRGKRKSKRLELLIYEFLDKYLTPEIRDMLDREKK